MIGAGFGSEVMAESLHGAVGEESSLPSSEEHFDRYKVGTGSKTEHQAGASRGRQACVGSH